MGLTLPPPPKVGAAQDLARTLGFDRSCLDETGQLLRMLAAQLRPGDRVAELGTGAGVGTAWLAAGLPPGARLFTVDVDPLLVSRVAALFADDPRVKVCCGPWQDLLAEGPFQLIFADVHEAKEAGAETVMASLALGGMVVLDDLTPNELRPAALRAKPDPVRTRWLGAGALTAVELRTSRAHSVILAVRNHTPPPAVEQPIVGPNAGSTPREPTTSATRPISTL